MNFEDNPLVALIFPLQLWEKTSEKNLALVISISERKKKCHWKLLAKYLPSGTLLKVIVDFDSETSFRIFMRYLIFFS